MQEEELLSSSEVELLGPSAHQPLGSPYVGHPKARWGGEPFERLRSDDSSASRLSSASTVRPELPEFSEHHTSIDRPCSSGELAHTLALDGAGRTSRTTSCPEMQGSGMEAIRESTPGPDDLRNEDLMDDDLASEELEDQQAGAAQRRCADEHRGAESEEDGFESEELGPWGLEPEETHFASDVAERLRMIKAKYNRSMGRVNQEEIGGEPIEVEEKPIWLVSDEEYFSESDEDF
mmetsp:Transcript_31694/g.49611  ORF Transcript_31694/g.49611 Transcript_31694/m.49611 type:complete len:235 (-) Transcript_31694:2070-2774(-)|eukprot:CAMPEP_0184326066 /NCGR_PEP_ID=MMETSP1049-20130417/142365_1 /TAXON_ID=77928 /ORGANISM="Proteomonas sulcata, Strain CCMP704" /LENGTH=234 /DNA_ID=CAMNT_0026648237 /DNA_START=165 /DNA_END=869 /DNA_ORIENTATION=+